MDDQLTTTGQESQATTPFKGRTLQHCPKDSQVPCTSKTQQQTRLSSPLLGTETKKQDITSRETVSIDTDSDHEDTAIDHETEFDNDHEEELPSQSAIDDTFGKRYDDVAHGVQIMDR